MEVKNIEILNNKQIKKCSTKKLTEEKIRVDVKKWTFGRENYSHENQLNNIKTIIKNNYKHIDEITKIILQQINKKIYGYRQQDIIKKLFNNEKFITIVSIANKMIECNLKCYYCFGEMNVLYDISRETSQWTVDRINNDLGHNIDNFHLSCLECNLKKRKRDDKKFLFTKQMKLIKVDNSI